jgi:hypothetical protein
MIICSIRQIGERGSKKSKGKVKGELGSWGPENLEEYHHCLQIEWLNEEGNFEVEHIKYEMFIYHGGGSYKISF